ncbi:MAG: hypothetical protein M3Z86_01255, partial [Lactobacillus panisapium]|nr:hypothetical protein [Lactobacillus panisapium]
NILNTQMWGNKTKENNFILKKVVTIYFNVKITLPERILNLMALYFSVRTNLLKFTFLQLLLLIKKAPFF